MIKYKLHEDVSGVFRAQAELVNESIFLKFKTSPNDDDVEKAYDKYLDSKIILLERHEREIAIQNSVTQYIENREDVDEFLADYLAGQADLDEDAAEELAEGRLLASVAAQHRRTK